jgi:hypothetical protein
MNRCGVRALYLLRRCVDGDAQLAVVRVVAHRADAGGGREEEQRGGGEERERARAAHGARSHRHSQQPSTGFESVALPLGAEILTLTRPS